jgi:hypothetical protein
MPLPNNGSLPSAGANPLVFHEEHNGAAYASGDACNKYFDLAAYEALSYCKLGNTSMYNHYVQCCETRWDYTLWGFRGPPNPNPPYQELPPPYPAYYLALYVLLGAKTNWSSPNFMRSHRFIGCALRNNFQLSNGGFATMYTPSAHWQATPPPGATANCETTSFVTYALLEPVDYDIGC